MDLSKEVLDFMSNAMCIDVVDLLEKINEPVCVHSKRDICGLISKFYLALSSEDAEDIIQNAFLELENLFEVREVYAVIDPLRHAFDGFAYGGLHQLYTRQENEAWYPKITLTRQIEPNDIDRLDDPVTIFRGCSVNEHDSKKYGQSWTTSIQIAQLFSHKHYENQPWFDSKTRVVLKAEIPRCAIFYSHQAGEFEVAVDTAQLRHVEVEENSGTLGVRGIRGQSKN